VKKFIIASVLLLCSLFITPSLVSAQTLCPNASSLSQHDLGDFIIAAISDTHVGRSDPSFAPGNFAKVTQWIADHKEELNIKFAFHTGDFVDGTKGIIPVADQWIEARDAMSILEWSVPYSVTPGNTDDLTFFDQYFGPAHFVGQTWYGGGFPEGSNESSYYLFSASGYNFVVYSGTDLTEAQNIFQQYPDYNVIFKT
jgi:hypothetical protein